MNAQRRPRYAPSSAPVVLAGTALWALCGCRGPAAPPPPPELFAPAPVMPDAASPSAASSAASTSRSAGADARQGPAPAPTPASARTADCPRPGEDPARCPSPNAEPDAKAVFASILVAWQGSLPDPRIQRTPEQATDEAERLLHKARQGDTDFFALMAAHTDDPGDGVYQVDAASAGRLPPSIGQLALRLRPGQIDRARSRFGWHVLRRLGEGERPPPRPPIDLCPSPCPLADEDANACADFEAVSAESAEVDAILIAWRGAQGGAGPDRSIAEARALAAELCHAARRRGGNFAALRAARSDDPGPGRHRVLPDSPLAPAFVRMALRLRPGGVGLVETGVGLWLLRRVGASGAAGPKAPAL